MLTFSFHQLDSTPRDPASRDEGSFAPTRIPTRILIVMPSWLGDCVMATPSLARLRTALPGAFLGGLLRPGMDQLLSGLPYFDQIHVERSSGVMGPKYVAAKLRPFRYDAAILLTNSFSTALIVRIAGIPSRVGYDRDARHLLLTKRLIAPIRADGSWAPISAVTYYRHAVECFLNPEHELALSASAPLPTQPMQLIVTDADRAAADAVFVKADIIHQGSGATPLMILNPGGNKHEKRWPIDRYANLAVHLTRTRHVRCLINGSPAESEICDAIAQVARLLLARDTTFPSTQSAATSTPYDLDRWVPVSLPSFGVTIASLKAIVQRCGVMVTNDTGPRHIAAALGVPVVSLFGPTDHRWTTIPTSPWAPEAVVLADPTLPENELSNDHPERCRIDRIGFEEVASALDRVWPVS